MMRATDLRIKVAATTAILSLPATLLPILWGPLAVVPIGCVLVTVGIIVLEIWS